MDVQKILIFFLMTFLGCFMFLRLIFFLCFFVSSLFIFKFLRLIQEDGFAETLNSNNFETLAFTQDRFKFFLFLLLLMFFLSFFINLFFLPFFFFLNDFPLNWTWTNFILFFFWGALFYSWKINLNFINNGIFSFTFLIIILISLLVNVDQCFRCISIHKVNLWMRENQTWLNMLRTGVICTWELHSIETLAWR